MTKRCLVHVFKYYRSGNIRKVLIFTNFARRTNLRISELREIILIIALPKIEIYNSRIQDSVKNPKIKNRENLDTWKLPELKHAKTKEKIKKHEDLTFYSWQLYFFIILTHLMLCVAVARHNFNKINLSILLSSQHIYLKQFQLHI